MPNSADNRIILCTTRISTVGWHDRLDTAFTIGLLSVRGGFGFEVSYTLNLPNDNYLRQEPERPPAPW